MASPRAPAVASGERRERDRRRAPRRANDREPDTALVETGPVVVTGVVGRLGKRLARALHRERLVIGLDRRPFPDKPKDLEHHPIDVRRKKARDIFRTRRVAALVHLGVMHDPSRTAEEHHTWNVLAFQKLLDCVRQYDVPKLIIVTSGGLYGPRPDNPQFITEDSALLGATAFSDMRDLIELDMLAQSFFWKHPRTETVVLRPAHILGTVRNAPSNYLRLPLVPRLMGFDPMVQVLHQDDMVEAIRLALRPGVRGIFNVAGPPPVPLSRAIELVGRPSVALPHPLARAALSRLWQWKLSSFPAAELDFIRYVCMVDDSRARAVLGYRPRYGLEETLRAVDEESW